MKVMKVDRLDEGAVPSTSTISIKFGGDIGSTGIRNYAGENRGGSLERPKIVNGEYNDYALVFFFNKENYAMAA